LKNKKQRRIVLSGKKQVSWEHVIFVLLLLLIVGLIAKSLIKISTQSTSKSDVTSSYSEESMHEFWDVHLKTLAQDQWANAQFPYPEINEHCKKLNALITEHTGKPLAVSMVTNYHWASKMVEAAAGFDHSNKTVSISLYIPSIMDAYKSLENSGQAQWKDLFVSQQTIILMHELEHAANGDVSRSKAIDITEESRAWAETCRYTTVPLLENYHLPINNIGGDLYKAWKECRADTNSPIWIQTIENHYGKFDGKTDK
jgi:hypothetical protein